MHKGTPDSNREQIIARTVDVALEIAAQAVPRIRSEVPAGSQPLALRRVRAYVQGHLCHMAGDIVSHPFINDIEWHLGTAVQDKLTHADGEAAHDAAVAQRVFGRGGLRDGPDWESAWPKLGIDVPDQLFAAYAEALEAVLKARTNRPKGLGEFEHLLTQLDPPPLEDGFLRDGYDMLKGGIVRHIYGHGAPGWALLLTPAMLPIIALPFMALLLPGLRFLPQTGSGEEKTERQVFELVAHALYPASLSALIYQAIFMGITMRGVRARQIFSLLMILVNLVLAVLFYVEAGSEAWSAGARWSLLFAVPLVLNGIFLALTASDALRKTDGGKHHKRRAAATIMPWLFSLGMFGLWVVFLIAFVVLLIPTAVISGLAGLVGGGFDPKLPAFWIAVGVWVIVGVIGWVFLSRKLRDIQFAETPDLFAARKRHAVRLFDEETLFLHPGTGERLAHFPSDTRNLARLWWIGEGTISIRSDRFGLAFRLHRNGADLPVQLVPAPVGPMTLDEYLTFLGATIVDHNGVGGKLQSRALFAGQDYELPPGAVFAAHGDDADTEEAVAAGAAKFVALNDTDNDATSCCATCRRYGSRSGSVRSARCRARASNGRARSAPSRSPTAMPTCTTIGRR